MNAGSHQVEEDTAYLHALCNFLTCRSVWAVVLPLELTLAVSQTLKKWSNLHFPDLTDPWRVPRNLRLTISLCEPASYKVHDPILGLNCIYCVECSNRAQHYQGSWIYTYLDVESRFILPDPTVTMASNAGALPPWDLSCAPRLFWFNTREVSGLGKLQFA